MRERRIISDELKENRKRKEKDGSSEEVGNTFSEERERRGKIKEERQAHRAGQCPSLDESKKKGKHMVQANAHHWMRARRKASTWCRTMPITG